MSNVTKHDTWLEDKGPAALVIREHLMPVEGHDGVAFPPTFAAAQGNAPDRFPGGYNIDKFDDGTNICLIDSVGSQANRIEPLFATGEYAKLVPQVVVKAGEKRVNLLEAGHRAGDAIVRCSSLQEELHDAFRAVLNGDCMPLAKIAPTSLVFGAWDSRDTQAKLPRLVASTVRAFNVRKLTRSAQYVPATAYVDEGLLDDPGDKKKSDAYAERGFNHVPATSTHGGVIADGGIRRDASLHLAALRLLRAGDDDEKTLLLHRYILGLALVAFTDTAACSGYLRQGCNLVMDSEKAREFNAVYNDGRRKPTAIAHDDALAYAKVAAKALGVGEDRSVEFDKKLAEKDLAKKDKEKGKTKSKKKKAKTTKAG